MNESLSNESLRAIILFHFKSNTSAVDAHRLICEAFGDDAVSRATCFNWFKRFSSGDYRLKDNQRSGRPSEIDEDLLLHVIEENPNLTTRDLAKQFNCAHGTIEQHLHNLGKVSKLGKWVPHILTEANKITRVSICQSLLSRKRRFDWLESLVTTDEKWILFSNVTRKRSWVSPNQPAVPTPRSSMMQTKIMISVWWDMRGIILLDVLPNNVTVNSAVYCKQIDKLVVALKDKRPFMKKIYYHHDNAPAHRSRITSQRLSETGWEILPHPAYSPDIAPSDYYLFKSLQYSIGNMNFKNETEIKEFLDTFFKSKPPTFWEKGIATLPARWKKVIENEGDYLLD